MNEEVQNMKIDQLENAINTLNKNFETLPDTITKKLESTMDLKIENAVKGVKIDFYKALVPVILGLLLDAAAVIFSFIKK